ncbi:MAG TPA: hypothetical protein HA349_06810 [Methanotrichaceae archaeon]|nr:hypothetical protein [Methanotrichaceae archaeon]
MPCWISVFCWPPAPAFGDFDFGMNVIPPFPTSPGTYSSEYISDMLTNELGERFDADVDVDCCDPELAQGGLCPWAQAAVMVCSNCPWDLYINSRTGIMAKENGIQLSNPLVVNVGGVEVTLAAGDNFVVDGDPCFEVCPCTYFPVQYKQLITMKDKGGDYSIDIMYWAENTGECCATT